MKIKYRRKTKAGPAVRVLMIPLFVVLSYLCIRLGTLAGNAAFDMDTGFIKEIDVQSFKDILDNSLPVIDTIYNSGRVNISLASEFSDLIKGIFNFDLRSPQTVLNAQSAHFSRYYRHEYQELVAMREAEQRVEDYEEEPYDHFTPGPAPIIGDLEGKPEEIHEKEGLGEAEEKLPPTGMENTVASSLEFDDISSVFYEDENDERNFTQENAVKSGKIEIQNSTKFKITETDIQKMLKDPLKIQFDKKGPKVLIFHTHTTESYIRNAADIGKTVKQVPDRTQDPRYNVTRIGDIISEELIKMGIETMHNGTIHDYPDYNSSYSNSLGTLKSYLKSNPSIKMAFDIHRDGLGSDEKLRTVAKINGKNAARVMLVVGTNGTGLSHPNWKENLKLAIKIQDKLNTLYPGLTKPILISNKRFNQHMTLGSLIIEVGGNGNTLDEAMVSAVYVAKAIGEVIK